MARIPCTLQEPLKLMKPPGSEGKNGFELIRTEESEDLMMKRVLDAYLKSMFDPQTYSGSSAVCE